MTAASAFATSRQRLRALLSEYQVLMGYAAPAAIPETGPVAFGGRWGDLAFELHHALHTSPQALRIRCMLGPLPDRAAEAVMRRLLELQRMLTPATTGVLSMDPASGEICLTRALMLENAHAASLLDALRAMRLWAINWRATYFLDEDDARFLRAADVPLELSNPRF